MSFVEKKKARKVLYFTKLIHYCFSEKKREKFSETIVYKRGRLLFKKKKKKK